MVAVDKLVGLSGTTELQLRQMAALVPTILEFDWITTAMTAKQDIDLYAPKKDSSEEVNEMTQTLDSPVVQTWDDCSSFLQA